MSKLLIACLILLGCCGCATARSSAPAPTPRAVAEEYRTYPDECILKVVRASRKTECWAARPLEFAQ